MSVASYTDIETYTGRIFSADEITAASAIIDWVTEDLELYLGRTIESATHTAETQLLFTRGSPRAYIPLDYTPVTSITSVSIDGSALTDSQFSVERSGVELLTVNFPEPLTGDPPEATITYVAGLGEPAVTKLKSLVIRRVGRIMARRKDDMLGVDDALVEGYRAAYMTDEMTEQEMKMSRRWKRRMMSRRSDLRAYSRGRGQW